MIHKKILIFIIYMLVAVATNIMIFFNANINSMLSIICSIVILITIIGISIKLAFKLSDLYQPITIVNLFLFFIFVLRPIQILMTENLAQFSYFNYYFQLYGNRTHNQLPISTALLIGVLGTSMINSGYWIARQKTNFRKLIIPQCKLTENKIKTAREWINVYIIFGLIILVYFLYKSFSGNNQIHYSTIDILWIYIFCVAVLLEQVFSKKINMKIIIILVLSILAFSILGNRQHIINLLLCIFIPYTYINNKKITKKVILLGFAMVFVIVWYGSLRRGDNLTIATFLDSFLREFSMFDMLVLGLDHKSSFNTDFYYGYNYFVFLNYIIPTINIEFFDFRHVQDVFRGFIGGGIPTSIIGSLYFNFSYIGVLVGSLTLGLFIGKKYNKYVMGKSALSIAYYSLFLTFIYDLTRVGDIGREIVNYLILFGCFKIALLFIGERNFKEIGNNNIQ